MAPLDGIQLERRARIAYEMGRLRRALVAATPVLAIAGAAAFLGTRPAASAALGVFLFLLGAVFFWRGQYAGRAVLPGVVAGLLPLSFALAARSFGHMCTGTTCVSFCVPACACGGFLAGLVITWFARRTDTKARSWACAGAIALLTGALGCSCVGYGGVLGMMGGLLVTAVPALARRTPALGR